MIESSINYFRILALSVVALPLTVSAQSFEIVDLGTLGGETSAAHAISPDNSVVGWSDSATGQRTPFLMTETGPMLSLDFLPYGTSGSAAAISSNGQYVAGSSGINDVSPEPGIEVTQGFLWQYGQMEPLGALYTPALVGRRHGYSEAHGVNDYGQVVGFSVIRRASAQHAFLWQNGNMKDITPLLEDGAPDPSNSRAYDINNAGQIVGEYAQMSESSSDRDPPYAVLWQGDVMHSLGTLPEHFQSTARAINEHAQIVGDSGTENWSLAVLWEGSTISSLGTLPGDDSSRALAINDNGLITGWSGTLDQGSSRAFLWWCEEMLDLNTLIPADSGWTLIEARGINNAGHIVGVGIKDGDLRAYLLEPAAMVPGSGHGPETADDRGQFPGVCRN